MKITHLTVQQLTELAYVGGGFHLDATGKTAQQLTEIAFAAQSGGARITINNFDILTLQQMKEIAFAGKGAVVFA